MQRKSFPNFLKRKKKFSNLNVDTKNYNQAMRLNDRQWLTHFRSLVFLLLLSGGVAAQTTFTVVCDKADNTIKVVESTLHSPGHVPIKGGFPFRQVATNWIRENYPSGKCDPAKILRNNQNPPSAAGVLPGTPQPQPSENSTRPAVAPPPGVPRGTPAPPSAGTSPSFRNTFLIANIGFSNLGGVFSLSASKAAGVEAGVEQLFGRKIYGGTGLRAGLHFTRFDGKYGYENQNFFMATIPFFAGYRKKGDRFTVMFDGGVNLHTKLASLDPDWEIPGMEALDNSLSLAARFRLGNDRLMVSFGSEYWLTPLFEDDDFRLSLTHIGLHWCL